MQVGKINCDNESTFCKKHGIHPRKAPRLYVYSYITNESGSFVEYNDVWDAKSLKSFCQEHLPRFSRRISLDNFQPSFGSGEKLPRVMLLSTKKDTPVIWRALSGLYRKRFIFYDTQVLYVILYPSLIPPGERKWKNKLHKYVATIELRGLLDCRAQLLFGMNCVHCSSEKI